MESQYQKILEAYQSYHDFTQMRVFEDSATALTLELLVRHGELDVLRWMTPSMIKFPVSNTEVCRILVSSPLDRMQEFTNEILRLTDIEEVQHLIRKLHKELVLVNTQSVEV